MDPRTKANIIQGPLPTKAIRVIAYIIFASDK